MLSALLTTTMSNMKATIDALAATGKAAQLTGRVDLPHTYTFIQDFGKALATLGERDEADGQAWHVPNDQPAITQSQFIELIAHAQGQLVRHRQNLDWYTALIT